MFSDTKQMRERISQEVQIILKAVGAILIGKDYICHSELHTNKFVDKLRAFSKARTCSRIANLMASSLVHVGNLRPQVVVGLPEGSIALASHTALALDGLCHFDNECESVWISRDQEEKFFLRDEFAEVIRGKDAVIVEDITTTGSSIREATDLLRKYGCNILGAGIMVNRGGVSARKAGVPTLVNLWEMKDVKVWTADKCPLCKERIPVDTTVGKGKEFLAANSWRSNTPE